MLKKQYLCSAKMNRHSYGNDKFHTDFECYTGVIEYHRYRWLDTYHLAIEQLSGLITIQCRYERFIISAYIQCGRKRYYTLMRHQRIHRRYGFNIFDITIV